MGQRARTYVGRWIAIVAVAALLVGAAGALAAAAAPPATPDLALALRFRPRLLFDSKELWRPLDVDRFLAEPGHLACPPRGSGRPCAPFTSVAQLTPAIAYLDLRGTKGSGADATAPDLSVCARSEPTLHDCDLNGRSVIYAHVTRGLTRTAIDYWWFLRFNRLLGDDHEGDWEGVTVLVDAAGQQVVETHLAAHTGVWRYPDGVPRIVDGHLIVYVAHGSHAAYPRRCDHLLCWQTRAQARHSKLLEGHYDGADPWVGNSAAGCIRRCVRLLPTSAGGAPTSWEAWDGRWGHPVTGLRRRLFQPPPTPAFQGRYLHPFLADPTLRVAFR
jgi:hypothetical protein